MQLPKKISNWFGTKGWIPHKYQVELLNNVSPGKTCLLIAPTGGGKTLASFLPSLSELITSPNKGLHTLYISPLKALSYDVKKNLEIPISEMNLPILIDTRTGDTNQTVKKNQQYSPPNFLMTTPESLALMLSWKDSEKYFENLKYLIVDEIHAIAGTKRGDLLCLGITRLSSLSINICKIGLSATIQKPNEYMNWLKSGSLKDVKSSIIQSDEYNLPDINIPLIPNRIPWSGHSGKYAIKNIMELISLNQTTIIFVNTRAQAEIIFQELWMINNDKFKIALHHGSLSKEQRKGVENLMSRGGLKAVVATSSLDLGIDWEHVDHVIQLGAPKGVSRLIQRVGRSGHKLNILSKASLIPTNRFEMLECHAAVNLIKTRHLDEIIFLDGALEVLAQHIVGLAISKPLDPIYSFNEIKRAFPFRKISKEIFNEILDFISTGGYSLKNYKQFHQLVKGIDGKYRPVSKRINTIWRMNVGTIVESLTIKVTLLNGKHLGNIEEYFVQGLSLGDSFLFAGRILEYHSFKSNTLKVINGFGKEPKIPAYMGGKLPLSTTLAEEVQQIIQNKSFWPRLNSDVEFWLKAQEKKSILPRKNYLLVEIFPRQKKFYLVAYCFEGRNAHQTLAILISRKMEKLGIEPLGFVATDYAIAIWSNKDPFEIESLFDKNILESDLDEWMEKTNILKRSFRSIATIAGLINRNYIGSQHTGKQMSINSDLIYDVLKRHQPDHFLLKATLQDATKGITDIKRLGKMLKKFETKLDIKKLNKISPLAIPIMLEIGKVNLKGQNEDSLLEELESEMLSELNL